MPNLNLKWNLPETYNMGNQAKAMRQKLPTVPAFRFIENEELRVQTKGYFTFEDKDKSKWIDELDEEILTRVAMSKYVTVRQLHEFMCLAGMTDSKDKVERRVKKLVRCRVLRECHLTIPEQEEHGLHCYKLDHWGFMFARELGVHFHKGNAYYSPRRTKENGVDEDTPVDVKRILMANQIILGLLKSHVALRRFGIMETFRPICDDAACFDGPTNTLFRPTMNIQIDDYSILAYEVIRDFPEAYEKIEEKFRRYINLVESSQYGASNYHNYKEVPQIIYCGESLEHNCKVRAYLQEKGLLEKGVTVLFTEDLLNIQNSSQSIYEIKEDGSRVWYQLPVRKVDRENAA